MKRAIVVSGSGRYADPWHPFAQTSAALAEIVASIGLDVEIDEQVDLRLADASDADLLITNIGMPRVEDPSADAGVRRGLRDYIGSGRPILAVHSSITSFPGMPEWRSILGGTWLRGTTMHPPQARSTIAIADPGSPVTAGMTTFSIIDERYSYVDHDQRVQPLLAHEFEGVTHPLAWFWQAGRARTGVDLLGHDELAYRSVEHRLVLARMIDSLVNDPTAPGASPTGWSPPASR